MVGDPLSAEAAARLLVGRRQGDEVALERDLRAGGGEESGKLDHARGLHVKRPAAVDVAASEEPAERIDGPVALVGVDHVDVVVEHDAAEGAVASDARHEIPPLRRGLGRLARDAVPVEDLGEETGARRLVAGRVRGVDTEIAAHQVYRLIADLPPVHHTRASTQCRPGFGRLTRRRSSSGRARSASPVRRAASSSVSWKASRWAWLPPTSMMRSSSGAIFATASKYSPRANA